MKQKSFHRNAFSLTRLRRELPPGGSLTALICAVKPTYKSTFETITQKGRPEGLPNIFISVFRLNKAVIAVFSLIYNAGFLGSRIAEHKERVSEKIHLHNSFFG